MIDHNLIEKIYLQDKLAISRTITKIEQANSNSIEILKELHKKIGNAYRIGITGPPGAGKSTLTNQLTKFYRKEGYTVGIIAVDPTSPFTGGALLGDRIRMGEIGNDPGVFIRSMASRGSLGGLSNKTQDAADVLDAAGYDFIIFETVGVGQSELDIVKVADTTIVVLVPESGDSIQAMKAGLMEIADIFVLNKGDRPGADSAITSLKTMIALKDHNSESWLPPIIKTIAQENHGINDVIEGINNHRKFLINHDFLNKKREENIKIRVKEIVEEFIKQEIWNTQRLNELNNEIKKAVIGKSSPYQIAENLINNYKNSIMD
ncbi:methylmalonyl Co-A mutase-associated GTPase MeaB [Melioribacteraceae bacterium 4301-Me]|uniref:methylmalonyl Co-A mutase-associated GTPase MeaB n=1 Tax=Pyranulibacter aquaticus TaxID=3163344 RepID=UPI0035975B31